MRRRYLPLVQEQWNFLIDMQRLLITGIGGSATLGFVKSLKESPGNFYIIGCDSNKYYLERGVCDEKFLIPETRDPRWEKAIKKVIGLTHPDFVYSQVDSEIEKFSEIRGYFDRKGIKYFMPSKRTVRICADKYLSYKEWSRAGIKVPETRLIKNPHDLERAFKELGSPLWIRETKGAFGKGSIPVTTFQQAKIWIDIRKAWGFYTAAELLNAERMVTWQSVWFKGKLVVAQTRKRLYWEFGNRAPSGVSGLTGTGITVSDKKVDQLAIKCIKAIDKTPHGILSVDFTYDKRGTPNPTEINAGRFFTTHYFFTKAGLNMPYIFLKTALENKIPKLSKRINPLANNLAWVRGLDFEPVLTTLGEIDRHEDKLRTLLES